jgi:ElaB/YqjD/DUF883 family membrane-anchored ribosome-binding protein
MSITSDIRSYADTALGQGKQAFDQALEQAQTQLNDVTGRYNDLVGKLTGEAKTNVSEIREKSVAAVSDLRAQAEKAVNLDAIKAAVEPYLTQAKGYGTTVSAKVEELLETAKKNDQVAKLLAAAESLTGTIVETVQERIVKPVKDLTNRGTKPAATKAPAKKAAAKKAAAKKAPAKAAPAPSVDEVTEVVEA